MSVKRNTMYNLAGSVLPIVITLITLPVYIQLIGEERFGVLAILWLILGYFGLFDLGLGRATAQQIAAFRDSTASDRAQIFWTAFTMNVGLGVLGGLLVWPFAIYFFGHMFKTEELLRPEINAAVIWLVLAVPISILTGTLSGALQGRERFLELNIISVAGTALFQLLPLAVAIFWSVKLSVLLPAAIITRLLTMLALFVSCKRHLILGFRPSFHKEKAGKLLRFGGWVTVTSFLAPMMVVLDRFIIGALMGAKAVTYDTVPFQLASRTLVIPGALARAIFPRFSAANNLDELHLSKQALQVLIMVMTPVIMCVIIFLRPFLGWWVGTDIANESTLVGQIILLGFWINGIANIPFAQLQARGRPDLVAKCHLFEVLPYFLVLYLGMRYFGLTGVAVAFSMRAAADFLLLSGLTRNLLQILRLLYLPLMLLATSFVIAVQVSVLSHKWYGLMSALVLVTMVWGWMIAPVYLKKNFLSFLGLRYSY